VSQATKNKERERRKDMSIKTITDRMIDFCLFGRSLSEFVKTYKKFLLRFNTTLIKYLWANAKIEARGLLSL